MCVGADLNRDGDGSFGGRYDAAALERIWQNLSSWAPLNVMRTKKKGGGWLAADVRNDEAETRNKACLCLGTDAGRGR